MNREMKVLVMVSVLILSSGYLYGQVISFPNRPPETTIEQSNNSALNVISQGVGDTSAGNEMLEVDSNINYSSENLQYLLPDELIDYLFLNPGDESLIEVNTPVRVGIFDHIRLVRDASIINIDGIGMQGKVLDALRELAVTEFSLTKTDHSAILSSIAQSVNVPSVVWDTIDVYNIKSIHEVVSSSIPGWKGLRFELEDKGDNSLAVYFLPTMSGDILMLSESRDQTPYKSMLKCYEVSRFFEQALFGVINSADSIDPEDRILDLLATELFGGELYDNLEPEEQKRVKEEYQVLISNSTYALADTLFTTAGFGLYATGVDLIDGNLEANFPASTKIE
ncbi:MAG: hypothetical protein P9L98_04825, partial [Candidatus Kaelpia imicola]|nr:hypothetical protein [Candidatus Kaelpia imicola]